MINSVAKIDIEFFHLTMSIEDYSLFQLYQLIHRYHFLLQETYEQIGLHKS